jgi:hypothetical protein
MVGPVINRINPKAVVSAISLFLRPFVVYCMITGITTPIGRILIYAIQKLDP